RNSVWTERKRVAGIFLVSGRVASRRLRRALLGDGRCPRNAARREGDPERLQAKGQAHPSEPSEPDGDRDYRLLWKNERQVYPGRDPETAIQRTRDAGVVQYPH